MHRIRVLLGFALLFVLVVAIPAQRRDVPNEVTIDALLKKENFTTLQLLVSTKDDVEAVFGKSCGLSCEYNDDWLIGFSYVPDVLFSRRANREEPSNKVFITYSKPEFRGKLRYIAFTPRKFNVLAGDYILSPDFDCKANSGVQFDCTNGDTYVSFYDEKRKDASSTQNRMRLILHGLAYVNLYTAKELFGETEMKDAPAQTSEQASDF